jgi:hypothetical protein
MDAKLILACLALGGLVSCTASAPAGPSPELTARASSDPYLGKELWATLPLSVNGVPDVSKDISTLPEGTHFKVDGIEQSVLVAGGMRTPEPGFFFYRLVLDDGRTVYLFSTTVNQYVVSDGPPENLSKVSDQEIVRRIIRASRQSYAGQCACPDDRTYDGRACGGRSAYSHKRGIMCYPADVTREQIAAYRATPHFGPVPERTGSEPQRGNSNPIGTENRS